mmetsp:Transcript_2196/g.7944  ORF Transcript_2196/g.7944 Transcript_2196/m.7944 type:complete len:360 (+) Transcript_2196:779-1858(+)
MLASLGWRWWMLVAMVDAHFVRWRLAAGGLCGVTGGTALFISEGGGDRLPELGSPACSSSQSSTTAMSMISGSSETTSDIPHVAGAPHVEMRRGGSLASAKGMMHLRSVVRAHPRELDVLEVLDLVLRQRAEVDDELPPRLAECARRRRERESAQKVSARSSRRPSTRTRTTRKMRVHKSRGKVVISNDHLGSTRAGKLGRPPSVPRERTSPIQGLGRRRRSSICSLDRSHRTRGDSTRPPLRLLFRVMPQAPEHELARSSHLKTTTTMQTTMTTAAKSSRTLPLPHPSPPLRHSHPHPLRLPHHTHRSSLILHMHHALAVNSASRREPYQPRPAELFASLLDPLSNHTLACASLWLAA